MLVSLIKIKLVIWLQQANPKKESKNNFIAENKFSDTTSQMQNQAHFQVGALSKWI